MICQFNNLSTTYWPGVFAEGFKCFLLSLCTAAQQLKLLKTKL